MDALTETPMFDELAFKFLDRGDNVTAIMARPALVIPEVDLEAAWARVEDNFAREQAKLRHPAGKKRTSNRKPRR